VFATAGVPALPTMQDLAAARGLDLSTHRSRGLDEHLTAVSDLLLRMTREQADLIGARTTGVVTRCFVLDELVALLTAVRDQPIPTGAPDGSTAVAGLPPTVRERIAAAHARRPFRRPDPADDVADPLEGSGVTPEASTRARVPNTLLATAAATLRSSSGTCISAAAWNTTDGGWAASTRSRASRSATSTSAGTIEPIGAVAVSSRSIAHSATSLRSSSTSVDGR
jgi:protein-tyrosine-phosphatase